VISGQGGSLNLLEPYQTGAYTYDQFEPITTDFNINAPDISFSNPTPQALTTVTVHALVHNSGEVTTNDILVRFCNGNPDTDSTHIGYRVVSGMGIESSQVVSQEWGIPRLGGNYFIYVDINPSRSISEFDYNNKAFKTISILLCYNLAEFGTALTQWPASSSSFDLIGITNCE